MVRFTGRCCDQTFKNGCDIAIEALQARITRLNWGQTLKIQTRKAALTPELRAKVKKKLAAKERILKLMEGHPALDGCGDDILNMLACLRFTQPTYDLLAEAVPLHLLDRTKSLIGRHLYVSERYPHPLAPAEGEALGVAKRRPKSKPPSLVKMFPLLQLDMSWINRMCGKKFHPCLLQIWLGPPYFSSIMLREIPLSDVNSKDAVPIELDQEFFHEGCRAVWSGDPDLWLSPELQKVDQGKHLEMAENFSLQILQCLPIGVVGPNIDRISLYEDSDERGREVKELLDRIWEDLEEFSWPNNKPEIGPEATLRKVLRIFGGPKRGSGRLEMFVPGDGGSSSFRVESTLHNTGWS